MLQAGVVRVATGLDAPPQLDDEGPSEPLCGWEEAPAVPAAARIASARLYKQQSAARSGRQQVTRRAG